MAGPIVTESKPRRPWQNTTGWDGARWDWEGGEFSGDWENQDEKRLWEGWCWRWRRESTEDREGWMGKEVTEWGGESDAVGRVDLVRFEKNGGWRTRGKCALGGIAIPVLWRSCSRCDMSVT